MKQRIYSSKEAYDQEINYIEARQKGLIKSLNTGWSSWNEVYMNGLEYGQVYALGGMGGVGKTTITTQLEGQILELNQGPIYVLNFNYEMTARRLIGKKISAKLGKSVKQLYSSDIHGGNITPDDIEKIKRNSGKLLKYPVYYVELPGSPDEMSDTIDSFCATHKIGSSLHGPTLMITFDNAQLLPEESTERMSIVKVMNMFNQKKKLYPKSISIILTQLNNDIQDNGRINTFGANKYAQYPRIKDMFGSSAIYNGSDGVALLHAPERLGITKYGPNNYKTHKIIFVHHIKVRDGSETITCFRNVFEKGMVTEIELNTLL